VALHYQRGEDPVGELSIAELRAAGPIDEPVEPGAGTETRVNGRRALLIDGAWEQRGDRTVWERGTLLRLILEEKDGVVIQLQADPREGWDAGGLVRVAESLR